MDATPKTGHHKHRKIAIVIAVVIVVIVLLWATLFFMHKRKLKKFADLADKEASAYADKTKVKNGIMDAIDEIISNPIENKAAKKYASDFGITYEEAVVDMAVAKLKQVGFIAP